MNSIRSSLLTHALYALAALLACPALTAQTAPRPPRGMQISSADFSANRSLPDDHLYPRCNGKNISPALTWSGAPAGTESFVLTLIDLDGTADYWSHWVIVDLPPGTGSLARGVGRLPAPAKTVLSNFGDLVYAGPCPPLGTGLHHYEFTIWAMPTATTTLTPNARAKDLLQQLVGSSLAHATLGATVAAAQTK